MPADAINSFLRTQLDDLKAKGLYKAERRIESPQRSSITVSHREVVNFCANNYLGLANHPEIVAAAQEGLKEWGYGLSSVRFICGTQDVHKELEERIARFFRKADSILYISCFDANGGLFEPLLTDQDAIISDELNHASIIDGVRLCKAQRFRYKHNDMADLKAKLEEAKAVPVQDDLHRLGLLDGRRPGETPGHLRPGRSVQRGGGDRRLPRHRPPRRHRPRRGRGTRRARPHRHHHRHARQDARRRERRLHRGECRDRRLAAQPLAAVPVLELGAAGAGRSRG